MISLLAESNLLGFTVMFKCELHSILHSQKKKDYFPGAGRH